MSRIDMYKHKLVGFIYCESDYRIVHGNDTRKIAIYKLEEDIPSCEINFDGKLNDILVGGGSGEAPAFRISFPEAFKCFNDQKLDEFNHIDELFKSFWSATEAYKLCNGFKKSKWTPDTKIELWLARQICCILSKNFKEYSEFKRINCKIELKYEIVK